MANIQPEPLATELLIKGTCNKNKVKTFGDSILALLHQKESEQELDAIITWDNKLRLTLLKIDQHLKAVKIVLSSVHSSPISNAYNQKINKLTDYLWIVSMCVLKCFIILQICGIRYQVKIECWNFNGSSY